MGQSCEMGVSVQMAIVVALGILSGTPTAQALRCPNVTEVSPCDCNDNFGPLSTLYCVGPDVTQDVMDRVLTAIKRENNGILDIFYFRLQHTNIVQLDLTPFEGGKLFDMIISNNSLLNSIVGPDLNSTSWNPIEPYYLRLGFNNLQDEGVQTMLHYFNTSAIYDVSLRYNQLRGSLGQEFLPGFSGLTGARFLELDYNNITALGGGQFRGMSTLSYIYVSHNPLEQIGEDAFVTVDEPTSTEHVEIDLRHNSLTEVSFHPSSGIIATQREATIILEDNLFAFVSVDQFLNFLEAYPGNKVHFARNPIFCSRTMKWLKDRREEFEPRVTGLNCVNHPGETAFTSILVDL